MWKDKHDVQHISRVLQKLVQTLGHRQPGDFTKGRRRKLPHGAARFQKPRHHERQELASLLRPHLRLHRARTVFSKRTLPAHDPRIRQVRKQITCNLALRPSSNRRYAVWSCTVDGDLSNWCPRLQTYAMQKRKHCCPRTHVQKIAVRAAL